MASSGSYTSNPLTYEIKGKNRRERRKGGGEGGRKGKGGGE